MLLENILGYLLMAFILTWFGFDHFILRVVNGFFNTGYGLNEYYIGAIILALLDTFWW